MRTERNAEASTCGAATAAERDQEIDEVDSRASRGKQPSQGGTHHITQTQPRPRPH